MSIDIREIELTDEQRRRIAELAEKTGRPWNDILEERLQDEVEAQSMKLLAMDRYIEDREKWRAYFRDWLAQQTSHNPNFDDSRESIYP